MKSQRIGFFTLIALLIVAIGTPLSAQDWVGKQRISGSITDQNNDPVEGAEVTIWIGKEGRGPKPMVTKKNGKWGFLGLVTGLWTVSVMAEGKMPSQGQVQIGSIMKPIQVRLRDIPPEMLYNQAALEAKKKLEEGNLLLAAGNAAGARAKYEEGMVDLDPEFHPVVLTAIGESYRAEDNLPMAIESLEKASELAPNDTKILLTLSQTQYAAGNKAAAIDELKKVVDFEPDNATAIQVLTEMLVAEGRLDESKEYMARLPDDVKLDPNALLNVGIDHYNAGEIEEALQQFDKVVAENPEMAEAYYYRGLVYLGKGENDTARADLEKFLALDPANARAQEAKDFLSYLEPEG